MKKIKINSIDNDSNQLEITLNGEKYTIKDNSDSIKAGIIKEQYDFFKKNNNEITDDEKELLKKMLKKHPLNSTFWNKKDIVEL